MKDLFLYSVPVFLTLIIVLLFVKSLEKPPITTTSITENYKNRILNENDPERQKKLLEEIHSKIGPQETFKLLNSAFEGKNSVTGHGWAHLLGSLLYYRHGIAGMTYCDLTFDFGCYHGFFGEAIPQEGIEVIQEADEFCIRKFGKDGFGCQHGIGHGVLEYFGYDKINQALSACSTLQFQGKIFGCQDGVFMDYNFPLVEDKGALLVAARQFNEQRPHEPCDIVPERYTESCYYSYPQWALAVTDNDYQRVSDLCYRTGSLDYRDVCLLGMGGTIFVDANYDMKEASSTCMSLEGKTTKILCSTAAAWVAYAALPEGKDAAEYICGQLDDDGNDYCLRNYNLYQIYGVNRGRVEHVPN